MTERTVELSTTAPAGRAVDLGWGDRVAADPENAWSDETQATRRLYGHSVERVDVPADVETVQVIVTSAGTDGGEFLGAADLELTGRRGDTAAVFDVFVRGARKTETEESPR